MHICDPLRCGCQSLAVQHNLKVARHRSCCFVERLEPLHAHLQRLAVAFRFDGYDDRRTRLEQIAACRKRVGKNDCFELTGHIGETCKSKFVTLL